MSHTFNWFAFLFSCTFYFDDLVTFILFIAGN